MLQGGPIILAALTAAVAAAGGAIGNRRPDFVPLGAPAFYWYCWMYFVLGGVVMWLAQNVAGFIALGRPDVSQYVLALVIGIAIRPLLQVRFFTLHIANQSVDVGFSALIGPFEGVLLNAIALHIDKEVTRFLEPYEEHFSDLPDIKKRIEDHLPDTLTNHDRQAFLKSIAAARSPFEALEMYLGLVGKRAFKRTFRLPQRRNAS